jgi:hypothetical protein
MEMSTKVKLSGSYVALSLLALSGEVSEKASIYVFIGYYSIATLNLIFATKIFNNLIEREKNGNSTSTNRNRVS